MMGHLARSRQADADASISNELKPLGLWARLRISQFRAPPTTSSSVITKVAEAILSFPWSSRHRPQAGHVNAIVIFGCLKTSPALEHTHWGRITLSRLSWSIPMTTTGIPIYIVTAHEECVSWQLMLSTLGPIFS
jgi:hypothetical protein